MSNRKPLPKGLRFEVFKRDKFKCQYCGANAPEVILNVDHIVPVAGGGGNGITNLITACQSCNSGKSDKPLSANAAVEKSRVQLEELQERREQLELMLEWHKGLASIRDDTADAAVEFFNSFLSGLSLSESGKLPIKELLSKYSFNEVCSAIRCSIETYHKLDGDNQSDKLSVSKCLEKLKGICLVNKTCETRPYMRRIYHLKNIAAKRLNYFNHREAIRLLEDAHLAGATDDQLAHCALRCRNWTTFTESLEELIESDFTGGGQ